MVTAMATIYKRGETYWIKWYEGGKPRYESLRTRDKKEAQAAKAAKEFELLTEGRAAADVNVTVAEFSERYVRWYAGEYPWASEQMRQYLDRAVLPTLGKTRVAGLTVDVVERWKHQRAQQVARSTLNLELGRLKALVNKAVEWGVVPSNPMQSVKPLQVLESSPRGFLAADELKQLYAANGERAPIWQFMANTGLRSGEAKNLRWEHVLNDRVRVVSTTAKATKSRRWRDVPISPGCRAALDALPREGEHVLPDVTLRTLARWFETDTIAAGRRRMLHELRHTFISHLVMQGVPLRTVQVLAGHSSIAVTEQYAHLAPDYMAGAVSELDL